ALEAEVARAKAARPDAFARFAAVKGYLPEGYLRTRARRPEASRELRALGPDALYPMLEALALRGVPHPALKPNERQALEIGLLAEAAATQGSSWAAAAGGAGAAAQAVRATDLGALVRAAARADGQAAAAVADALAVVDHAGTAAAIATARAGADAAALRRLD